MLHAMNTATTVPPLNAFTTGAVPSRAFSNGWETIRSLFGCRQRNEKLERLVAQYRILSLEGREANRAAAQIIEVAEARARKRSPSWSEIAAVERALLSLLTGQ